MISKMAKMAIRAARLLAVLGALAGTPVAAQQRPTLPPGTGSISGRVLAGDSGKPIRNALVEIVIYGTPSGTLSGRFAQATTDVQSAYLFPNLPGRALSTRRSGDRLHSDAQFGQLQPGPAGLTNQPQSIDLGDGQAFTPADFTLQHFNAIEGVVTDEFGDPAPNVRVAALAVALPRGAASFGWYQPYARGGSAANNRRHGALPHRRACRPATTTSRPSLGRLPIRTRPEDLGRPISRGPTPIPPARDW